MVTKPGGNRFTSDPTYFMNDALRENLNDDLQRRLGIQPGQRAAPPASVDISYD
jgi:hypothetical protein